MSCCPPGSWGACAPPAEYQVKGKTEPLGANLNAYVVRPSSGNKSNKGLIVFADIFGNNSGRTKAICDDFAERLDCMVILADYLEGDEWKESWGLPDKPFYNLIWFIPSCWRHNNKKTLALFESDIKPYLQKEGIDSFGTMGICAGACHSATLSMLPGAKAHVGYHPSYIMFGISRGLSMEQTLGQVKCPQLYCVGANDFVKPGGPAEVLVREKAKQEVTVTVYEHQRHGWVNRGDVSKPEVAADVEKALNEGEAFLKKYLV